MWKSHRPTQLLCAAALACWSGVPPASQSGDALPLPDALRAHLKAEKLGIVTSIRGLPLGVREALQTLFGSQTLDIADPFDSRPLAQGKPIDSRPLAQGRPGGPLQGTNAADRQLPARRLIAAGCADDNHCVVYYERGGSAQSWHVAMFHWRPELTRFEWGGLAPRGLKSIEDVRKAMLSGAIKAPGKVW